MAGLATAAPPIAGCASGYRLCFPLPLFTTFHMERLGRLAWPVLIFGSFTHSRATTRAGFREDDHTFQQRIDRVK
ncbi:hypothetical protein B6D51_11180 [Pseudomonas chlororaphis subsp. chlororaphis]|nr:hypothetical protein B6D51_11180 [Pseudomonas chlororaphis subsp. chlororaphis]